MTLEPREQEERLSSGEETTTSPSPADVSDVSFGLVGSDVNRDPMRPGPKAASLDPDISGRIVLEDEA